MPNRFLRMEVLSLLLVSRSLMNSPCASMTIWHHCLESMPRISPTFLSTSLTFLATIWPLVYSSAVGWPRLGEPSRPVLV